MTFALTAFKAHGIRQAGATRNHSVQVADFVITGATSNTALDISGVTAGSLSTFWTNVTADATYGTLGTNALNTIRSIQAVAKELKEAESEHLSGKSRLGSGGVMSFLSAASVGGAAAEVYTVTGLLATDTVLSVTPSVKAATGRAAISTLAGTVASGAATGNATVTGLLSTDTVLAVTQDTKGANSLPLLGYGAPASNALPFVYSADPGANGTIRVLISRAATTDAYTPIAYSTVASNALTVTYGADPGAGAKVEVTVYRGTGTITPSTGQYTLSITSHLPVITFATTDAPTSHVLRLVWELVDGIEPIFADYGAAF